MPGHHTRNFIRVLIGAALCAALIACAAAPVPEDLSAIALRQSGLYRLEVALFVFYGALLLITPAFSGLFRGRLPTEISTRGAKFAEEADQAAELAEAAVVKELERSVSALTDKLKEATFELNQMKKRGDST
jgi:hypothetical protein